MITYVLIYLVVCFISWEITGRIEGKGKWLPIRRLKEIIKKEKCHMTWTRYFLLFILMPFLVYAYAVTIIVTKLEKVTRPNDSDCK